MSNELLAKDRLKVVFDTNIYISAFLKSGFSRQLFDLAIQGKIILFCSRAILLELQGKLRKKFRVRESEIQLFLRIILKIAKIIYPTRELRIIKTDPQDNIILECALEAGANLIVSLDRHLLKLKRYQKIGIVHPKTLSWIFPNIFEK